MSINNYPVYFRGKILDKSSTAIIFTAPCVQYGIHAFEGILSINIDGKNFIFRLEDHIKRLLNSCRRLSISLDLSENEIIEKTLKYISYINPSEDCNIRISIFPLEGSWSTSNLKGEMLISAFKNSTEKLAGSKNVLRLKVTNIEKPEKRSLDHSIKVGANYLSSRYAHLEAIKDGFDTCLLTNFKGEIAESGGSNIFFIKNSEVWTPNLKSNILNGITRDTIKQISLNNNITYKERVISIANIDDFESAFLCGTSMRIKAISLINKKKFNLSSKIFQKIFRIYKDILYKPNYFFYTKNWHKEVY